MWTKLSSKRKIKLTEKQRLLLEWLCRHGGYNDTANSIWQMLLNERHSKQPDECVAIYDEMVRKEKIEVELIFARYVAMEWLYNKQDKKSCDLIDYLSYEEV